MNLRLSRKPSTKATKAKLEFGCNLSKSGVLNSSECSQTIKVSREIHRLGSIRFRDFRCPPPFPLLSRLHLTNISESTALFTICTARPVYYSTLQFLLEVFLSSNFHLSTIPVSCLITKVCCSLTLFASIRTHSPQSLPILVLLSCFHFFKITNPMPMTIAIRSNQTPFPPITPDMNFVSLLVK
jgi:hypothetical protein